MFDMFSSYYSHQFDIDNKYDRIDLIEKKLDIKLDYFKSKLIKLY